MEVVVALALSLAALVLGYALGLEQGRMEGACEEMCGEATTGLGGYRLVGMSCQCVFPENEEESGL